MRSFKLQALSLFTPPPPPLQNTYRHKKNIFELFSGLLPKNPVRALGSVTEINFCPIISSGSGKNPAFAPQKKGLLPERGSYQNKFEWILFSGLLRDFLVRAPGHLPDKTFFKLFW